MSKSSTAITVATGVLLVLAASFFLYDYQERARQRMAEYVVYTEKGIALFRMDRFDEALSLFERIPPETISDWRVSYYQASSLIKLKRYEAAIPHLERSLALNTEDERIPMAMGTVYYRIGMLSLAKGYFAAALEIDPTHGEAQGLMDVMARLEKIQPESSDKLEEPERTDGGA